ncbi:SubName: Full=Uncharacterized protein {ECO:0000313/EMBL:CCA69470.1} [Serendipita indica DSM 11827]|nr:SubName: Full=Uncharacterized protein {ECO:0000313/EMBL:CCA69470.1} [Serendipita indica DSM 11827]
MSAAEDEPAASTSAPRSGTYYPAPDELDPNVPINLSSLRDAPAGGDGKPLYSRLIEREHRYAIKGSPENRLLLEEIYYAIEQRYPYFKTAPAGWKNSVRHNLSLNSCFQKVPRPLTDRGKGSYWTVDDSVDPKQGIHRVRSRRRKNKHAGDHTASPGPYGFGYGGADGSYDAYAAMYPYGYENAMFPPHFAPPGGEMTGAPMTFADGQSSLGATTSAGASAGGQAATTTTTTTTTATTITAPGPGASSSSDHGPENVDWKGLYLSELERLKTITREQDKEEAPQEWYRMMSMRLRMGMMGLAPFTGIEQQTSHLRSHHRHDLHGVLEHEAMDDSGVMEEDDEEDE